MYLHLLVPQCATRPAKHAASIHSGESKCLSKVHKHEAIGLVGLASGFNSLHRFVSGINCAK